MGEEFVSCSKKCKKVTKFAYMLRQNNEQEVLRAFESMLRKKLKKQVKNELIASNRNSVENKALLNQYESNNARVNFGTIDNMRTYKSQRGR